MRKTIIITFILAIMLQITVYAQNKFSINTEFNPNLTYLYPTIGASNYTELPLMKLDYGISAKYFINDKINIGISLLNSKKGSSSTFDIASDNTGTKTETIRDKLVYDFIEMPIFLEYKFKKEKHYNSFKFGLIYQRILSEAEVIDKVSGVIYNTPPDVFASNTSHIRKGIALNDINKNNLGILLAYGTTYIINNKLNIGWDIRFKTTLLKIPKNPADKMYLYSLGINIFTEIKI